MKKNIIQYPGNPIPVRMEVEQTELLEEFQSKTGLGKSFIIRRCISYALRKFSDDEVDILTLKEKK
ncbi:MAG: hypothetical protein LBH01_04930 [Verrucomicrobiales bacterium]|jgi:predicted DNA-binding protein|nr:hypothetical protein [Verrucomicrobiales bacterium]